ncbi:unnamed protein product [Clavelina lepadiformis]|uniref:Uncharacterized protein n=1 Tax=Clavelina lepadiformis TaxID=159417 RepID=A0ABP0GBN1_CLALP
MITWTGKILALLFILGELSIFLLTSSLKLLPVESAVEDFLVSNNIWQEQVSFKRSQHNSSYEDDNLHEENWKCNIFSDRIYEAEKNNVDEYDNNDVITHVRHYGLDLDLRQCHVETSFYTHKTISALYCAFYKLPVKK